MSLAAQSSSYVVMATRAGCVWLPCGIYAAIGPDEAIAMASRDRGQWAAEQFGCDFERLEWRAEEEI